MLERFIRQSKAIASSSLAKRQISTMSAAGTTRNGSLFAGASAPMRSPNFAARRCWISSNVILSGHLVVDAERRLRLPDLLAGAEPVLADDLVLHAHQAFRERLRSRRAARDVDGPRHHPVHAPSHPGSQIGEAAPKGAGAPPDHPPPR